jgi:hypothetical protein
MTVWVLMILTAAGWHAIAAYDTGPECQKLLVTANSPNGKLSCVEFIQAPPKGTRGP